MRYIQYINNIAASLLILFIIGCKSDDTGELSEEQLQIAKLAKQWEPTTGLSVTLNNENVSSVFQDFTLVFDNQQNYTSIQGNSPVWPEKGTYAFEVVDGVLNLNRIIRSDGVVINITELTENSLKVEFFYDSSLSNGRTLGISGDFSFDLMTP